MQISFGRKRPRSTRFTIANGASESQPVVLPKNTRRVQLVPDTASAFPNNTIALQVNVAGAGWLEVASRGNKGVLSVVDVYGLANGANQFKVVLGAAATGNTFATAYYEVER